MLIFLFLVITVVSCAERDSAGQVLRGARTARRDKERKRKERLWGDGHMR